MKPLELRLTPGHPPKIKRKRRLAQTPAAIRARRSRKKLKHGRKGYLLHLHPDRVLAAIKKRKGLTDPTDDQIITGLNEVTDWVLGVWKRT